MKQNQPRRTPGVRKLPQFRSGCAVQDCGGDLFARGRCMRHWQWARSRGLLDADPKRDAERRRAFVEESNHAHAMVLP
jgi:hypothetical protein